MSTSSRRRKSACPLGRAAAGIAGALLLALSVSAPVSGEEEDAPVSVRHGARTFNIRGAGDARVLQSILDSAQEHVRACRKDLYENEIAAIERRIFFYIGVQVKALEFRDRETARVFEQNEEEYKRALAFLESTKEHRFRDCRPPTTTAPPRIESVLFGAGAQFDSLRRTPLGTLFIPGNDRPFLLSRGTATGFNVGLAAETGFLGLGDYIGGALGIPPAPTIPNAETLRFGFNFSHSSATASASSSPGDAPRFTLFAPFNGTTVIALGRADARVRSSAQTTSFYVNDNWRINDRWSANMGVRYERKETEHDGRMTDPTTPGFFADQRLNTNDNYIGPVFGLGYTQTVNTNGAFPPIFINVNGWVSPSLRISDGSATQHVVRPGVAPPFNDITVGADRNRAGFAFLTGINASAEVPILPNVFLGVHGGFTVNTAQSYWDIPISPGGSARLRSDARVSGHVGLRLRVPLDTIGRIFR